MTAVVHVVVGPSGHGVVQHATRVAEACGHALVRRDRPDAVTADDLVGADVVHVPVTERLFGPTVEDAARAFAVLAARITAAGASLSLTLHDLPAGDDELARRRRAAYRTVVAGARGVVVSSRHELALAEALGDTARSRRVIPLPVDRVVDRVVARVVARVVPDSGSTIGVLGFLYPGKGVDDVLHEAPEGVSVVSLGGAADGHPDEPGRLAACARAAGVEWRETGFVADADLADELATVTVPVAPHRHVSASGSVGTWIAHGRRPLVPDVGYMREIDRAWPGTVRRYDAEHPGALRDEIAAALDHPERTVIDPRCPVGPSSADVARQYREHLESCAMPAATRVGTHWVVPANRVDLLDHVADPDPAHVSVVVPYYEDQRSLDLVLTALTRQDHPTSRLEVIVADDGSHRPPRLDAAAGMSVRTVHQPDEGFRAGTARNLGARAADGEVLAFLDGDTVPEPDYLSALIRLPSLARDALVVGRRRHAEADSIRAWLAGSVSTPEALPEPAWLARGYTETHDLRDGDARSYRYVISAVLAMHRDLFAETSGFCEQFRTYGGEDWELAARAWHAGALVAHVPGACAWHVGPDWAGRAAAPGKDDERRMLARLLPDPVERPARLDHIHPATVIVVEDRDPGGAVAAAGRLGLDAGVWWPAGRADPPVRPGTPPPEVLARATTVVTLTGEGPQDPLLVPPIQGLVVGTGGRAWTTRSAARARRVAAASGEDVDAVVARLFGRRDVQ